ncbi:hypothetical protein PsYK624_151800 [Phanerochaete sordida]|uniref:Uncharacterized protein n=1 Tax=Phanerochaete sordida TaxID=48140 RepID=A0A9P3GNT8_9APHY|nr:hypothetical protein PsYK624_151800 [Phanerochaete sordida]
MRWRRSAPPPAAAAADVALERRKTSQRFRQVSAGAAEAPDRTQATASPALGTGCARPRRAPRVVSVPACRQARRRHPPLSDAKPVKIRSPLGVFTPARPRSEPRGSCMGGLQTAPSSLGICGAQRRTRPPDASTPTSTPRPSDEGTASFVDGVPDLDGARSTPRAGYHDHICSSMRYYVHFERFEVGNWYTVVDIVSRSSYDVVCKPRASLPYVS